MNTAALVATHRRPDLLRRLLESLRNCEDAARLREILVVENGGRFGAEEVVRSHAGRLPVRYAFSERANKSAALNHGLGLLDVELIVFFDDDVDVRPGTISAYLEAAERHGRRHFFGGRVTPRYETGPPPDWLADALPMSCTGFDLGPAERTHHEFIGNNWAAFREEALEVGGFSSRIGPGSGLVGQETELQARLIEGGWTGVYLPDAVVDHYVPAEHLTVAWARRRRYRQKVAHALLKAPSDGVVEGADAPIVGGVPRYLWRSLAEQYARVWRDRLLRPRTRRRVASEMRLAAIRAEMTAFRMQAAGHPPIDGGDLVSGEPSSGAG
ncbi:MAG: glycosyltransferase [Gemmatimonadota bacterium]